MQLKKSKPLALGPRLALATGALLGAASAHAADSGWQTDSAVMFYNESGGRVSAIEPVINIKRTYDDGSDINARFVYDSLTGSSPNGAARANVTQTFTSASGAGTTTTAAALQAPLQTRSSASGGSSYVYNSATTGDSQGTVYSIAPGALPLDPSFSDQRFVGNLSWGTPLQDNFSMNLGGNISTEHDFTSVSFNGALLRDFNDKNTTLSLGTNLEFDNSNPIGGVPVPLSTYVAHNTTGSSDNKQVYDLMFGVTQIWSRRWIMQLNFSVSKASGYQNDPYKILTVATDGNLIADPTDSTRYLYLYESRPRARQKDAVYLQNKIAIFNNDVVNVDYRYMKDDWGVKSQTANLTYHWQYSEHFYLEPHVRYYRQTAADFYQPFLSTGTDVNVNGSTVTPLLANASSDPRLGAFSADTVGLKLGFPLSADEEFTVRAEYYQQHDQNTLKAVPVGSNLYGYSQFAPLKAAWVQIGYHYRW